MPHFLHVHIRTYKCTYTPIHKTSAAVTNSQNISVNLMSVADSLPYHYWQKLCCPCTCYMYHKVCVYSPPSISTEHRMVSSLLLCWERRCSYYTITPQSRSQFSAQRQGVVSLLHLSSFLLFPLYSLLVFIQNGLTPLEVARAKQDDDEVEEKRQLQLDPDYMQRRPRKPKYHSYEDYGRVIDLLGEYSEEPATLPSHDVSIDWLQLTHMTLSCQH